MSGRSTRVLVTHRLDLIRHVPHIVVLGERGVVAQGTYSHLIASNVDMGIDESHTERDMDLDAPGIDALSFNPEESAAGCNGLEGASLRDAVGRPVVHDGLARMTEFGVGRVRRAPSASPAASAGARRGQDTGVVNGGKGARERSGTETAASEASPTNAELIKEEERETGLVKRETYDTYLQSIGQEMLAVVASLGLGSQLARVLVGWWISQVCTC